MVLRGARLLGTSLAALVCFAAPAADEVSQLQARFDRETNSVHKAKLLEKLGDAQMEQTRHASQANDYKTLGLVMEKYRDNARAAVDALKKDHRNLGRCSGGIPAAARNCAARSRGDGRRTAKLAFSAPARREKA